MLLTAVKIDAFRSVKEPLILHLDGSVTVLIGANDHGKTNLLEAIRALHDDPGIEDEDQNWDVKNEDAVAIEWHFRLNATEQDWLRKHLAPAKLGKEPDESEDEEGTERADGDPPVTAPGPAAPVAPPAIPDTVIFERHGVGAELKVRLEGDLAEDTDLVAYLMARLPRVELFEQTEQLMDHVTLAELELPAQECMQGIFRYAGIWDERTTLFKQGPGTSRRLEKASEEFTKKIRAEWKQGGNLAFKFEHAGQEGNKINLLIQDPAVSERLVRPSERSAGFSAFFRLNMMLLARTEARAAGSYVLLFDEPGTGLHPSGQVNLQRVFERLARDNQIVYATHSLFLVNHNRPERNRVISKDEGGTKIDQKPFLRNWHAVREALGLTERVNDFETPTVGI